MGIETISWIGIAVLVLQSATFSGLNLALFGVSALRLQTLVNTGNKQAKDVLELRKDSNFSLTTILWGNVGTNVLLAMLSDSLMTGLIAFCFSTFVITFGGEIIPQAYFSRNALRMASLLSPMLRLYQIVLFPLAKPSALILDAWLGEESVDYLPENEIKEALRQHLSSPESDISLAEGIGAINFMALDDIPVSEGDPVDPKSVVRLPHTQGRPVFPAFEASPKDAFLQKIQASGKRWVLIAPEEGAPTLALDADSFLRTALFDAGPVNPVAYCHQPVTVNDPHTSLSDVLGRLETTPGDDVIDQDLIILWGEEKRIITGGDLLGYLMRGIVRRND